MKFPTCEKVVLFKNGNTVVLKELKFSKGENKIRSNMPSSAIHGTFWVTTNEKVVKILSIKSVLSDKKKETEVVCTSIITLLKGNIKREIYINDSEKEKYEILEILTKHDNDTSGLVVLKNSSGMERYKKISDIKNISSATDKALKKTFVQSEKIEQVEIEYISKEDNVPCNLFYIMKRCTWAPSYKLTLNTEKHVATFKMQSTILNNAEDFFTKMLICAAGAPKQEYQTIKDPFVTSNQTIESFFNQLSGRGSSSRSYSRMNRIQSNMIMSNVMQQQVMPMPSSSSGNEYQPKEEGSNATDWYYYTFEKKMIAKDQRMILPVFSMDLKYKELYKVKLHKSNDPLKVTHCVKITNESDHIWTTGPVTISSEKQLFAGQSTIFFTVKGVPSLVEIADALSIRVKFDEEAKINKKVKKKFDSYWYVESTTTCNAEVMNYQSKDIAINLNADFAGKFIKSSVNPLQKTQTLNYSYTTQYNTKIDWEIQVAKNKTKKLTYSYTQWVRDRGY